MKNNIWKTSGFFQPFKLISNNPIFTGAARFLRQNQVVVDIVIAHKLLELVLLLFPFPQDEGKSSRNPNLTNTAFCFRLFQNEPRRGFPTHQAREYKENVLFANCVDSLLVNTGQLLFNPDEGIIPSDFFIRYMNTVPCKASDFAHPHGAGKGQVDCNIQLSIRAVVESISNNISSPDSSDLFLPLGQDCILKGIFSNNVPADSLVKCTAHQLNNLFNGAWRNKVCPCMSVWSFDWRRFLQPLDELIH